MLFGESTDRATAEQLLGSCMDAGVSFFDCAEMYPVPQRAETYGRSEEVLGDWLKTQKRRVLYMFVVRRQFWVCCRHQQQWHLLIDSHNIRSHQPNNQPQNVDRDAITIATKAAGPSGQMTWIRDGPVRLDRNNIAAALDGSLRRLKTDYIDLYQLHWPDR